MIRSWQITSLCTDVHLPTEKFALNSTELKSVEQNGRCRKQKMKRKAGLVNYKNVFSIYLYL